MRVKIEMQRLAPDMEAATIIDWVKQIGDEVAVGDVIVEVGTDKIDVEMEAMDAGTLAEIVHGSDAEVPVGEVIGWLEQ